ncbi:MAG TPA: hypothetical protein VMM18_02995 [Gemmatimonadaceae bacterium]|nr:hypothetical protein [Gemmatimonadaceae bacterium]
MHASARERPDRAARRGVIYLEGLEMQSRRLIALVALAAGLVGCAEPTAPPEPELLPRFAATVVRQELVVQVDVTAFIDCAGEDVRFTGSLVFRLHQTSTPSGRGVLHVTVMPHSPDPVQATGQSSGTVWTFAGGASSQTVITSDGAILIVSVARNERYVAADGSVLELHSGLQLRMHDGEAVMVEHGGWTCR